VEYLPGTRKFFENFTIPGAKVQHIDAHQGCVHVTLGTAIGADTEALVEKYMKLVTPLLPICQIVTVSVETSNLK